MGYFIIIKKIRLREIQDLLKKQQIDFNQGTVNKTMDILISDFNKKSQFVGKSPYNQTIIVDTSNVISKGDKIANYNTVNYVGKIKKVKIIHAFQNSLEAKLVPENNLEYN